MNARFSRRLFLSAALIAALMLPLSTLWAQSGDRPALKAMLGAARGQITEITPAQAKDLLSGKAALFVDVRTDAEWAAGHLPGAKHLDRGKLEFMAERAIPDKSTAIVVYCKSGDRGALSARTLMEMGYTNVINMAGGFVAWDKAGYEKAM